MTNQDVINFLNQDAVPRTSVEYICRKNTVSTNPYEHKYHDKFIQFMDDPEISDFGRWQHSNGFNTALVAVKCDLDKVPSAQPTLFGYDIKHLMLIAYVLRKENLPPERVFEALADIGRIVSIVTDEFEEALRKSVEGMWSDGN